MTEIGREIEASSKSIYGVRCREALFLHMLIGVRRIIAETIEWLESTCGRADSNDGNDKQQPKAEPDPVNLLEQNPLGYVRTRNGRIADTRGFNLYWIPRISFGRDTYRNFSNVGDLIESIGARALQRLQEDEKAVSSRLAEALMERAWQKTKDTVRQGIQVVVRSLYLISGAYSHGWTAGARIERNSSVA